MRRRLLAPLAITAALGGGGLAGLILTTPGVSGAQTATTTPSTTAPANGATPGKNCPHMNGTGSTSSSSTPATNASGL